MSSNGTRKHKTYPNTFVYTDHVLKHKPIRKPGQDIRDLPTYTIPEAASSLGIPSRTLRSWFSGSAPLLTSSAYVSGIPLLSFNDAVEAYAIFLLRSVHDLSMQSIRRAIAHLPEVTKARNPLVSRHLKVFETYLLWNQPKRLNKERRVINLSKGGQLAIPAVVDVWANRVLKHSGRPIVIFPWRYWAEDRESKPVEIDPQVMSGRLVVTGTRIPVDFIAGRIRSGESIAEIAGDYRLPYERVARAIRHLDPKAA